MKLDWKAYFIFSEKELKAIVVIGLFISISCFIAIIFPAKPIQHKRFYFDPNTLDSLSAIQLGLLPKHFNTLSKYRTRGGRFYTTIDLLKWYGVPEAQLKSLLPYVRIAKIKTFSQKRALLHPCLDINRASMQDLMRIHLQPYLAKRVIRYKEYLGGYQTTGQLKKVYGMTDQAYQTLLPHLLPIKAISVKMHWSTMNYKQIASLGILEPRAIWEILQLRKEKGKMLSWEEVISRFDLTKEEAYLLKAKTDIQ